MERSNGKHGNGPNPVKKIHVFSACFVLGLEVL